MTPSGSIGQEVKVTIKGKEYRGVIIEQRLDKFKVRIPGELALSQRPLWFCNKELKRLWS